jgi:hypothetical protein
MECVRRHLSLCKNVLSASTYIYLNLLKRSHRYYFAVSNVILYFSATGKVQFCRPLFWGYDVVNAEAPRRVNRRKWITTIW